MIQKITNLIISPKRPIYNPDKDLGPTHFSIDQKHLGVRVDFKVRNRRGHALECSFFHRTVEGSKKYPLMLYCHGNIGNRTHSYGTVYSMLRSKINVITFDFAGCGLSEGNKISLGYYEQDDIEDILDYAIKHFNFIDTNRIGIWGRCMGAVSAILFTARTHCISVLVLDSPFPDFVSLIRDYIQRVKIIPKWAEDYMYQKLRKKVKVQANFDFEEVKPIEKVAQCTVPAFFIHGRNDAVIPSHLFRRIYDAYPGQKEFLQLDTSHNGTRDDFIYETIASFVKAKFYSPKTYRHFEPTPKHANCKTDQVILTESGVASLDTFRFNENIDEADDEEGLDATFANIAKETNDEYRSFDDLDEGMEGKLSKPLSKKDIKSAWKLFNHNQKNSEGKIKFKDLVIPVLSMRNPEKAENTPYKEDKAEEECEISEDLSDTGKITNRDYLEMSCIENAAKSTFDSFRLKKSNPLSVVPISNYTNM